MKHFISLLTGLTFGLGLILSGMYSPDVILSGLKIGASTFSWTLYLTFVTAVSVTFLLFQLRKFLSKPLTQDKYNLPTKIDLDSKLLSGALLFGIGWGLCGICPGPNIVGLGVLSYPFYWINFGGIFIGFIVAKKLTESNRL